MFLWETRKRRLLVPPVKRRPVRREKLASARRYLRRDPSTLTFGSGFSFAGRSRNEGLRSKRTPHEKALQAFRESGSDDRGCSKLSKEGSQRASFALVSGQKPGRGARQKRAAERCNANGPSLGGFDPRCSLNPKNEKSGFGNAF